MSNTNMDRPICSREGRERPKQPPTPRVASNSSFSSANTHSSSPRHTSNAAFSSFAPPTPTSSSHPTHRYHHQNCSKNSVDSRGSQSRDDNRHTATPMSSILQERLQRERQIEGDRSRRPSGAGLSASIGDLRDRNIPDSPIQRSATAVPREAAADEQGEQKGFGVKEMEKALSTLHKQNFDLKLELYHRRERQNALESRLDELEAEKAEAAAAQNSLQSELDSRDKAISEAVAMIVQLEAKVEELTAREMSMVRQVEATGPYQYPGHAFDDDIERSMTPKAKASDSTIDVRGLPRMPSFLSDHSFETEHLRSIVLANTKTFMHTRNTSDASADPSELYRVTSPSLSVLSESSFASVYGANGVPNQDPSFLPITQGAIDDSPQRPSSKAGLVRANRRESVADLRNTPSRGSAVTSTPATTKSSTPMQSLNQFLGSSSPSRKSSHASVAHSAVSPQIGKHREEVMTPSPSRSSGAGRQNRTINGPRDLPQKVITTGTLPRDFGSYGTLPPTPDTVTSSVLRKYPGVATSQESLNAHTRQSSQGSAPRWTAQSVESLRDVRKRPSRDTNEHLASLAAFSGGPGVAMPSINTDVLIASFSAAGRSQVRPHSASASLSTRSRANSWVSDDSDDSDGGADATDDDYDYWMQESLKPNKPADKRHGAAVGHDRSSSPDLFSFPANGNGWEPDQIFGALRGIGVMSSPVAALKRDPLEEMSAALIKNRRAAEMQPAGLGRSGPPAPHRNSSLHARTGSTDGMPPVLKKTDKSPLRGSRQSSLLADKTRSQSMDTSTPTLPPKMQPLKHLKQQDGVAEPAKKTQYPPIAGQTAKGRLNAFFRRSGSISLVAGALSGGQPQSPVAERGGVRDGRSSVPPPSPRPWALHRNVSDTMQDDQKSATPPPILRNRPHEVLADGESPLASPDYFDGEGAGRPFESPTIDGAQDGQGSESQANNSGPVQGKRRWLGLGRVGGAKNK